MTGRLLHPGESVGGYTVERHLGAGGSSRVYLVRDGSGAVAALKSVDAAQDEVAAERLRREVRSLMAVRHPAVPRVLDAELDSTDTFVVFEYVPGMSLAEHVFTYGPLSGQELAAMAESIAGALEAAHVAGVVHRDVTPSNVMMSPHGAMLIDFGLSHRPDEDRLTREGLVSGTAGYVAPEVIDGADPAEGADRWSWAATVAFAATGQAPFGVGNSAIRRTLAAKWKAPAIPGGAVLHAALTLPPDQRPGMRDVIAALHGAGATAVLPGGAEVPATAVWNPDSGATDVIAHGDPGYAGHGGGWDQPESWDEESWETQGFDDDAEDLQWEGDDESNFVLMASGTLYPPPVRRPVMIAAWTVVAAAVAMFAPVWAAVAIVVAAWCGRLSFYRAEARAERESKRDLGRSDRAALAFATPWFALKALATLLPSVITAGALGIGAGAAAWHLVSAHVIASPDDAVQWWGHAGALAFGALVFAAGLWWGLWSWPTRQGSHQVAAWFAPSRAVATTWVLVAVLVIVAVVAVGGVVGELWWWPLPPLPQSS